MERMKAAAVALRPQSACPSTLLRDPADGEAQQQKKSFEGFVTHFFLTKPAKLFLPSSYFRGQPSAWLEMRNRSFPVTNFVCPDKTVKLWLSFFRPRILLI
ncbi:MAG: hypothetical protein MJZ94_01055 [Bacteroidales bacterium]|nr:hypothetical protein [Bacteroidales bacterium]